MRIERRFTKEGQSPYEAIPFRESTSEIRNPDGSVVFRAENIEVPAAWSQVASDVLAQKYFRKAGVPARLKRVEENDVPSWLWRSVADEAALAKLPEAERTGSETSAKQVFDRLAGCWTYWGWKGSYFSSEEDARAFHDELRFMLAKQMVAPNSPQWFNTGLSFAYGITGPAQGHYYVDAVSGRLERSSADAIALAGEAPLKDAVGGPVGAIVEATGSMAALAEALPLLAEGGTVLLLGYYDELRLPYMPLFLKQARLLTAREWAPGDLVRCRDMIADGSLDVRGLLTHHLPISQVSEAYHTALHDPACLKLVLEWSV